MWFWWVFLVRLHPLNVPRVRPLERGHFKRKVTSEPTIDFQGTGLVFGGVFRRKLFVKRIYFFLPETNGDLGPLKIGLLLALKGSKRKFHLYPRLPNTKREEVWLDPQNIPKTPNLRRYDWKPRDTNKIDFRLLVSGKEVVLPFGHLEAEATNKHTGWSVAWNPFQKLAIEMNQ